MSKTAATASTIKTAITGLSSALGAIYSGNPESLINEVIGNAAKQVSNGDVGPIFGAARYIGETLKTILTDLSDTVKTRASERDAVATLAKELSSATPVRGKGKTMLPLLVADISKGRATLAAYAAVLKGAIVPLSKIDGLMALTCGVAAGSVHATCAAYTAQVEHFVGVATKAHEERAAEAKAKAAEKKAAAEEKAAEAAAEAAPEKKVAEAAAEAAPEKKVAEAAPEKKAAEAAPEKKAAEAAAEAEPAITSEDRSATIAAQKAEIVAWSVKTVIGAIKSGVLTPEDRAALTAALAAAPTVEPALI
jgi:flagellar biosynthesis GTPase FlhF